MKKSKLRTKLVLCIAFLICFSARVNAASSYAILTQAQSSATSKVIGLSKFAKYSALNDKSSLHKVYANIYSSEPGKGWKKVKSSLMNAPGIAQGSTHSSKKSNWKLELKVKMPGNKWCKANGKIYY